MKHRILSLISLIVICLMMRCTLSVHAVTPLDTHADASLTLCYQKDGKSFPDLDVSIYRVAEAFPDGTFELIEPYASFPINIHGITVQEQWQYVAQTLNSYITAEQVEPNRVGRTEANGMVHFSDLDIGLYFVREVVAENSDGTYVFNQFMVYLPTPLQDGTYNYSVEAYPKCTSFIPKTQYTVVVLWQDAGYENNRPKEVTVDIYKDGVLQDTRLLSASHNWSHTWQVSAVDYGRWSVAERSVPDIYKVTVQQNGGVFYIINTCQSQPEIPPTGDSFSPMLWILAMCFSGIMLLILGLYSRRRQ